jgi:hypothetical protein
MGKSVEHTRCYANVNELLKVQKGNVPGISVWTRLLWSGALLFLYISSLKAGLIIIINPFIATTAGIQTFLVDYT